MEGLSVMTDQQFAEVLRSHRTLSEQDVERIERERSADLGLWISPSWSVHHTTESRH